MITLRITILAAAAVAMSVITCCADLGDTPEKVGATMKSGLVYVKLDPEQEGRDRHMIEALFVVDHNINIFKFLDGKVCREVHIAKNDAPQDDYITVLLYLWHTDGHTTNVMPATGDTRRWRRDDGVDMIYGDIIALKSGSSYKKPPPRHVLIITAPEWVRYLQRIQANQGGDIPGSAPSVKEIRSRIESALSHDRGQSLNNPP